ncbi:MAG: DUF4268 domain-containing protein [Bacillus sp. (in: Bacteria)]|nr:DUF4268 domain-containing protein [Bacillus sp. (in: firmicutes)]
MAKLGKLKEVNIREVWPHEQFDFSKWLAQEENIQELGDTLNLSLTDIETEKFVGSYRCDILGKDELSGKVVLIENQLEPTNHDHLGKIITYASGLDASVVVWIVESARDEHASAIEWLNKYTTDELAFFLVEVHAYKIGDSLPAPYFKIIEQPNDFAKTAQKISKSGKLSTSQEARLDFWTKFNDVLETNGKPFNKRKATTDHWYSIAIGTSQAHISIDLVNKEHRMRVGLWISDNKDLFDVLYEKKEEIEAAFGEELEWNRLDDKKASLVCTYIKGLDFKKQDNYPELMQQAIDTVVKMRSVMKRYL